jgi:hypothetical protein
LYLTSSQIREACSTLLVNFINSLKDGLTSGLEGCFHLLSISIDFCNAHHEVLGALVRHFDVLDRSVVVLRYCFVGSEKR